MWKVFLNKGNLLLKPKFCMICGTDGLSYYQIGSVTAVLEKGGRFTVAK